jgi:hypothetical protein
VAGEQLDKLFRQSKTEMLALGRVYWIVGSGDKPGDPPIVTVESPFQVTAIRDPRTRRVVEAVKLWHDVNLQAWANLYQPNRTVTLRADGAHWAVTAVDEHNLGRCPVVPMVNRSRLLRPNGISEFHDVIPIVDAAIKLATDMMIAAEFHAIPRRWIFGVKKEDFIDPNTVSRCPRGRGSLAACGRTAIRTRRPGSSRSRNCRTSTSRSS